MKDKGGSYEFLVDIDVLAPAGFIGGLAHMFAPYLTIKGSSWSPTDTDYSIAMAFML